MSSNFDDTVVIQPATHKQPWMILNAKLDFQEHLKDKLYKMSKAIKSENILTIPPLITMYNSFIGPHLEYGDIIYDYS